MLSTASLATLALLFSTSFGHMIMQHPVPYGVDTLNNSPLVDAKPGSSSSDYPCKQRTGVYDISTMNEMKVGSAQELNFTGSASHGGGTCQIAISLDKEPTATSTFKIVQVFEGGCPNDQNGNDGSHPFTFTLPKDFPNGQATLAWTWYNKIGNREIYMNCAPIQVTGGSDTKDLYNSLPNQYLINLPTTECSSVETSDQLVPNPGQYILTDQAASISAATGPSCKASAAAQTSGVSGYKSAVENDGAAYSAVAGAGDQTAAPASSEAQATSAPSYGSSGSASASASSTMATISTADPVATSASASVSYPTMTVSSGVGISGSATAAGTGSAPAGTGSAGSSSTSTCTTDGAIMCNGTSQFGICNNGNIVWQAVAAGTTCSGGKIQKRSDVRHAHIRRHAQNAAKGVHNEA